MLAARRRCIVRAIAANPSGLTATETPQREEAGFRTIRRDLEALQGGGLPLYTRNREKAKR